MEWTYGEPTQQEREEWSAAQHLGFKLHGCASHGSPAALVAFEGCEFTQTTFEDACAARTRESAIVVVATGRCGAKVYPPARTVAVEQAENPHARRT